MAAIVPFFLLLTFFYAAVILLFYIGILRAKNAGFSKNSKTPAVTVLIPARNEAQTIKATLASLAEQDYPRNCFEVIIIDDHSTDETFNFAQDFVQHHKLKNFKVISHQNDVLKPTYKKSAIAFGLKASTGQIILTTDADCQVLSSWIASMVKCYDEETGLVAGLVRFEIPEKPKLIHRLQALEFAGLVYCGVGAIGNRYPLICNASNLSYRREVYDEVGGFSGHEHIPSGDDDLFMQMVHRKTKWHVRYNLDSQATNTTTPVNTIGEFLNQRARWASKGSHYPDLKTVLLLLSIYLYYFGLLVLTPITILGGFPAHILAIAYACKLIPEYLVVRQALIGLKMQHLMRFFLIAQFLQVPYIVIAGFAGFFNLFRWKRPE